VHAGGATHTHTQPFSAFCCCCPTERSKHVMVAILAHLHPLHRLYPLYTSDSQRTYYTILPISTSASAYTSTLSQVQTYILSPPLCSSSPLLTPLPTYPTHHNIPPRTGQLVDYGPGGHSYEHSSNGDDDYITSRQHHTERVGDPDRGDYNPDRGDD
jgi:hypothetical protein